MKKIALAVMAVFLMSAAVPVFAADGARARTMRNFSQHLPE